MERDRTRRRRLPAWVHAPFAVLIGLAASVWMPGCTDEGSEGETEAEVGAETGEVRVR